ncbi:MAG: dihydrolipoamide acetyltransferase family protein [Anaerolineales bacterium]|jgi:2-oxoglutarate dehydrogenase E2 component (dihydrolipoamide succinyltransferase)
MATQVKMPQLGESVVEGTIAKWLKREGETVQELEPLVEIDTDKVDTEIPAPATGKLLKVYVGEGTTVKAGTLLAIIGREEEVVVLEELGPKPGTSEPQGPAGPVRAARVQELGFVSPVVAKVAAEHQVDLLEVRGTGLRGRITKKDVLSFLEARRNASANEVAPAWERPGEGDLFRPSDLQFPKGAASSAPAPATPADGEIMPLSPVRRQIAERMVRSKSVSAHVTTVMEADLGAVLAHRDANRMALERDGVKLTLTPYFVLAAVSALKAYPEVNSSWEESGIRYHRAVHIGVAVSLGSEGLVVPVIKEAEQKSLLRLAMEVNDLSRRARSHQLKAEEVQGGTFTLTNHGVSGSLLATPIINPPQCAILGVGLVQKRVVVIGDAIAIRPMAYLTLTFDHRILDGARADAFLAKVIEILQMPGS